MNEALCTLTRKPDRAAERDVLDEVFDRSLVATVSTVVDGQPWVVPTFVIRDGNRLLLHGSTGAGALRHVANGAPVAVSAFLLDALVVAERQFEHSANYRSAVVRGTCTEVGEADTATTLDLFTERILPGRPAECPAHTTRELAATLVLELAITGDNWIAKQRSGPPSMPTGESWVGVIPVHSAYGTPVSDSRCPLPNSVCRLIG